jgi:hypothetical protein
LEEWTLKILKRDTGKRGNGEIGKQRKCDDCPSFKKPHAKILPKVDGD